MTAPDGKLKVFISWSMPLSHDVAKILRDWLPRVIQDVEPWVSSEDIEKGTYWTEGIVQSLDAAKVGIIVVTPENHERTWLNFEAGALARSIKASGGMVTPLLIDIDTTSIQGPMTTLQITNFTKEDVTKLLVGVNVRTARPVSIELLTDQIEVWWPRLASSVSTIIKKHSAPKALSLTDREILEELLTGTREIRRISFDFVSSEVFKEENEYVIDLVSDVFKTSQVVASTYPVPVRSEGLIHCQVTLLGNKNKAENIQHAVDTFQSLGPYRVKVNLPSDHT